jgi:Na+-driven multidrug efflux pump
VSNELGASRPKEAKFSVAVAATTSAFIGAIFMAVFFIWRRSLPRLFSDNEEVVDGASRLGYLLAVTVFFGSIGPVLSGNYESIPVFTSWFYFFDTNYHIYQKKSQLPYLAIVLPNLTPFQIL